jgi:AcrR family transcriptional regulator
MYAAYLLMAEQKSQSSDPKRGPGVVRRTRTPRAQRRQQLLELAERLVLEGGVAALTMERLAEEAGVAKTVPYSHFPNSSAVLLAILERHWQALDERLGKIAEREEMPIMVFLREFSAVYLGEVAAKRLLLRRLLQAAKLDDAARMVIRKRQNLRMLALAHALERDLGLGQDESRPLATFILGALGALGAREYRTAAERARVVDTFVRAARGAILGSLEPEILTRLRDQLKEPLRGDEIDVDLASTPRR